MRLRHLTLLFFLFLLRNVKAQSFEISGQVVNSRNQQGVPFVNIKIMGGLSGLSTDSAGNFKFNHTKASVKLRFTSIGYQSKEVAIKSESYNNLIIFLDEKEQNLDLIVIKPLENPAWEIIRNVLKNKELNNPEKKQTYETNVYSKIKLNALDLFKSKIDSQKIKGPKPPVVFEYASKSFYKKPRQKKEIVFAANTNFLKSYAGLLLRLPLDLHITHFYNEIYNFYPQKRIYSNPLNSQTFNQYDWQLIDSTNSAYKLFFRPYKGRNFNGFKGQMLIDKKSYALKYVLAETEDSLQQIKIKLEHTYIKTDSGWFPKEIRTGLSMQLQKDTLNGALKVDFFSAFDSIKINEKIDEKIFDGLSLEFLKGAERVSDSTFNLYRQKPLDSLESLKPTYNKAAKAILNADNKYSSKIQNITAGVIDFKYGEIIVSNALNFNKIEGIGLGFTYSNKYINKPRFGFRFSPSYGISDKRFKVKSELSWFMTKNRDFRASIGYNNNYRSTVNFENYIGPNLMYPIEFQTLPLNVSDFKYIKIYRQKSFFGRIYLKPLPFTILKLEYTDNLNIPLNTNVFGDSITFKKQELSGHIRFAFREKINRIGLYETTINRYYPIINLKITKGLPSSGYSYWNYYLNQFYQIRFKKMGITEFQPKISHLRGKINSDFLIESNDITRITFKDPAKILNYINSEKSFSLYSQINFSFTHDFNNFLFKPKTPYTQPRVKVLHSSKQNFLSFKNDLNFNETITLHATGLEIRNLIRIPVFKRWIGLGGSLTYFWGPNAPTEKREKFRVGFRLF